jgi:hypothetical protein
LGPCRLGCSPQQALDGGEDRKRSGDPRLDGRSGDRAWPRRRMGHRGPAPRDVVSLGNVVPGRSERSRCANEFCVAEPLGEPHLRSSGAPPRAPLHCGRPQRDGRRAGRRWKVCCGRRSVAAALRPSRRCPSSVSVRGLPRCDHDRGESLRARPRYTMARICGPLFVAGSDPPRLTRRGRRRCPSCRRSRRT